MERSFGIIFRNARQTAGLTQERWAESLGLSVDAIQNYEYGRNFPTEETVLLMADLSGYKILPYQYMSLKSRVAESILPEIGGVVSLPKAVLNLIIALEDLQKNAIPQLMMMAADGKITEEETRDFEMCMTQLDYLAKRMYEVKFAKEDP